MSTATPPPAAVTFDHPPADEELQSLVDPDRAPPYLRLVDDGTTLTAHPRPVPPGCIWGWLGLTAAGIYLMMWWFGALPLRGQNPLGDAFTLFAAVLGIPAALLVTGGIVNTLFARPLERGPFLTLDRAAGTLTLLRAGVTLRRGDVVEVVEVQATHWVEYSDGWSGDYLRELSVLAREPGGRLTRYPVAAAGHAAPVRRVAAELAEVFGVPRRVLVRSWFRNRWRRVE